MSPILKFESAACRVISSNVDAVDKARRLHEIAAAIDIYLKRANPERGSKLDAWQKAFVTRSLEYLKMLQRDLRKFAVDQTGGASA